VSSNDFEYADETQQWFSVVFANHLEEARSRALSLVAEGTVNETGCIETPTLDPRKVRFLGRQLPAYRFIYCVLNEVAAGYDDVVRHRCNNRRCINPEHLEIGSRGENLQDERDFSANGVDFNLL
jgi:HNH endonuclease